VGLSSQLVSNPCSDVLLCFCENSLYCSKAEEAEVENKWDAAEIKKLIMRTKLVNCLRADLMDSKAIYIALGKMSFGAIWITVITSALDFC